MRQSLCAWRWEQEYRRRRALGRSRRRCRGWRSIGCRRLSGLLSKPRMTPRRRGLATRHQSGTWAWCCTRTGSTYEAEVCYRIARECAPRSMSWIYLSGVVQAKLGADAVAADFFRESLRLEAGYLPARVRLADSLMRSGALEAGRREYQALVRQFPDLALAHYGLGRVKSVLGDSTGAAAHFQRAVDLEPEFGPAHYSLALAYRHRGSPALVQAHLEAYRQFGTRSPALRDRLLDQIKPLNGTARDLLAEGVRLGEAGRLTEAIAVHLKAVAADPADAQAHVNLISLYGRVGNTGQAASHYRAALGLGGSLADAHYNYGVLLAAGNRYEEAAAAFRLALGVDSFHAPAHNNLAALLARHGRLADAASHYRQALASDPQHRAARFNLGRVLVALDRPLEAVDELRKLSLFPEDADTARYLQALATAYVAAGDLTTASDCRPARTTPCPGGAANRVGSHHRGVDAPNSRPAPVKPNRGCLVVLWLLLGTGLARPGADTARFREIASEAGLRFHHVNGASGRYHLPEIMGAGGALFDFDRDGDLDVLVLQGRALDGERGKDGLGGHRLFRNDFSPRAVAGSKVHFTDVTDRAGFALGDYGMGVAVGDYDNDGDPDVYITNYGPNRLYRNNGDGTFTDVTATAGSGLDDPRWSTSATFSDYDADGDLDLFVANYLDFTVAGSRICSGPAGGRDYCGPLQFRPVPDRVFRNNGNGTFTDVSDSSGSRRRTDRPRSRRRRSQQ